LTCPYSTYSGIVIVYIYIYSNKIQELSLLRWPEVVLATDESKKHLPWPWPSMRKHQTAQEHFQYYSTIFQYYSMFIPVENSSINFMGYYTGIILEYGI